MEAAELLCPQFKNASAILQFIITAEWEYKHHDCIFLVPLCVRTKKKTHSNYGTYFLSKEPTSSIFGSLNFRGNMVQS